MQDKIDIIIQIKRNYLESSDALKAIEPDNDDQITVTYNDDCYEISLNNVKISSISSLTMDILESIEFSKKIREEEI